MKKCTLFIALIFISIHMIQAQDQITTIVESPIEESEISMVTPMVADPEEKRSKLEFSGSIDAYFRSNLDNKFENVPGTSFANLPGFSLGMANLILSKEGEKAGFVADFVVGPRGAEAVFGSPSPLNLVNQLYVYWKASNKLTFTLGNFNTFLGYEVISPVDNFNYSTSYMFSYGPFSHSGLKADYELGGGFSIMAGVFNPTDFTDFNPLNNYVGGAQLGYEFEKGSVFLNSLFDSDFFQIDLTAGIDVTEKLYLGVNATTSSDNFYGVAGYVQVAATEKLKIGTRVEYFSDEGVAVIGINENVLDATITANYEIGDLTLIPEFRIDLVSHDVFDDGAGGMNDNLSSFLLAVVYAF